MGGKGSGGHNRKDPALHFLRGTYRPDRHGPREESLLKKFLERDKDKEQAPRPPKGLSKASTKLWKETVRDYEFDYIGLKILELALDSLDRALRARDYIQEHGQLLTNERTGREYLNPAIKIESQSMNMFLKLWKALNLE